MGGHSSRELHGVHLLKNLDVLHAVAECCGLGSAHEVRRDRDIPVVVGYPFYRALGELVKSGRIETRWGARNEDDYGRSWYRLAGGG